MSALAAVADPPRESWIEILAAATRPEFAVDRYLALPGDVLFGAPECVVDGCWYPGSRTALGLCYGHGSQFTRGGGGEVTEWITRPGDAGGPVPRRTRLPVVKCSVGGCRRSADRRELCAAHLQRWRRARARSRAVLFRRFVATTPATFRVPCPPDGSCALPSCQFPRRPEAELCDHHHPQFHRRRTYRGYASAYELEDFVLWAEHPGRPVYSVAGFGSPLREELRYVLQCRSDARAGGMRSEAFPTIRQRFAGTGRSLLDHEPSDPMFTSRYAGGFLSYARDRVSELADSRSGQSEWDRDVWRLTRLPGVDLRRTTTRTISFTFCRPGWLRTALKRWVRWRLSVRVCASTAASGLRALRRFVLFAGDLDSPAGLTRELLDRFLTHVLSLKVAAVTRNQILGLVRTFLADCHRHDWIPGLDPKATYYRTDFGRRGEQLPRFLSDHVMAQVEDETNLAWFSKPTVRIAVEILIGTGLRASDALNLPFDALSADSNGAPYLRYLNSKLARERYLPISAKLAIRIREQQARVRAEHPAGCEHLLPRDRANPDGTWPLPYGTLICQLRRWQEACHIREADGTPAHITPHRFRHTLATRMINRDVPEIAVQQMLDHNSPTMTRVYAKLHDSTLREHYDRYQERINIEGEVVRLDPDGPLSDAGWAKQRLSRAKLTLPNGYCGLPIQQHCPHPNACLTCPSFLTTVEFLPQHREQLERTNTLIGHAEADGRQRLVEMNAPIRGNLVRIIDGLQALETGCDDDA